MLREKIRFLVLLALLVPACSEKPPIPEKEFVELYVQLQLLDAQYGHQPALQKVKVDSLLRAFKVNDSLVGSALSWYGQEPERWRKFFAHVQERVNEIKGLYLNQKR
jgi:hypothetical protein